MKILNIIIDIIVGIIAVVAIAILCLPLFGITPLAVKSGSMEPAIHVGSVCFVNENTPFEDIKEGDVIAFKVEGTMVTHRVVDVSDEGLQTKGDANDAKDGYTTKENYVGKNIFSIPELGYATEFIQTTSGKIIIATVVVALILLSFLIRPKETAESDAEDEYNKEDDEEQTEDSLTKNE